MTKRLVKTKKLGLPKNGKYLDFYLKFLKLEIPNILQIVGFITFFGLITSGIIFKYASTMCVLVLLNLYLIEKYYHYVSEAENEPKIIKQMLDQTLKYRVVTVLLNGVLQIILLNIIKL